MNWKRKSEGNWGRLGMRCKRYTLSELATIKYGKNQKKVLSEDGNIPIYGTGGLMGYATMALYDKPSVLIGRKGTIGKVKYVEHPFWTVDTLFYTIINTNIVIPKYLYYVMSLIDLNNYNEGTTIPSLRTETLNRLEFDIPSIEEQEIVLSYLNPIDGKIKLNNAINNNLEEQAQTLFKSWFVYFEPFNGTMPSDWEIVPLKKIADFQNGYAFKSKELLNEPSPDCYQVFKQGHIARSGGFIPDGTKSWYPKSLASKLEKFVLKKGDILMAMTDMKDNVAILGNTAVMPLDNEYIVNQRVGHLRTNGYKGVTYPFIYLLTNSTDFLVDLRNRANSGVQVNLSSSEIKASQTVLPSEEVNNAFSEITLPMFEIIINNQLENQRLAQLRDTLLPKLMSGELDVSDINP